VIEHLCSKSEALSSNPTTTKETEREREELHRSPDCHDPTV
jgi:hypothetical protein